VNRSGQWALSGMRTTSCVLEWPAPRETGKTMVAPWC
jgi:hypothetical protein